MIEKLTGIIDGLNGWEVITNNRKPLRDKLNEIIDVVNRLEDEKEEK